MKINKSNPVKGYKVFGPDWTVNAVQFSCPGKIELEGNIELKRRGLHFCKSLVDCFRHNSFDSRNRVAEVIAYGEVLTDGTLSCTNKMELVREMPWVDVLRLVNFGDSNTGYCNTGDSNTGYCNTGDGNTGDGNTGDGNSGNRNTGDCNSGNGNTGSWNTGGWNTGNQNTGGRNAGDWNAGDGNTGVRNSGDWNTGDNNTSSWNTGSWNTGNRNSGDCNAGDYNTGDWNTGSWNAGDWNACDYNTGCFNTVEQKITLFNKPSDMTYRDWLESDARRLLNQIPRGGLEWVYPECMSDEEKSEHPTYEITGGYLKVLDRTECAQNWWRGLADDDKNIIKSLPNFDPLVFQQCTGIILDYEE